MEFWRDSMKQQRTTDLSTLANQNIKIVQWNYPTEVVIYKNTKLILINSMLSETERIKDLRWAIKRLEEDDNEMQ